jgi:hypothetical protein
VYISWQIAPSLNRVHASATASERGHHVEVKGAKDEIATPTITNNVVHPPFNDHDDDVFTWPKWMTELDQSGAPVTLLPEVTVPEQDIDQVLIKLRAEMSKKILPIAEPLELGEPITPTFLLSDLLVRCCLPIRSRKVIRLSFGS